MIDDYFPVRSGVFSSSPAFATSGNNREVWVQVIVRAHPTAGSPMFSSNTTSVFATQEKAYAKCHHDFHAIEGGFVSDGLVDLTGGSGSTLSVADARDSGEILSGTSSSNTATNLQFTLRVLRETLEPSLCSQTSRAFAGCWFPCGI